MVNGTSLKTEQHVFSGTVWGPPPVIVFLKMPGPRQKVRLRYTYFCPTPDDLNCFKSFGKDVPKPEIMASLNKCQSNLHSRGRTNQVQFDPKKESFHILHQEYLCSLDFEKPRC